MSLRHPVSDTLTCIYIHTYIHTDTHAHTHTHTYIYICLRVYVRVWVCVGLYELSALNTNHKVSLGWRRLVGCLKLRVIFSKRATNYRALLRKMIYEDKASYDSTPPCMSYLQGLYELSAFNTHR